MLPSGTTLPPAGNEGEGSASSLPLESALDFACELCVRYELSPLTPLVDSCRSALSANEVNVAVVGRFKAGKSSLLNRVTGRPLLPVGVVPVTTVITEIRFGPREKAAVHFLDGRVQEVAVHGIASYVSERDNPGNRKGVRFITVDLPSMDRFRGLKFVDTPGLESALEQNTQEAANWLPNVGLALVAVSADSPLSQHDIGLLKRIYQFTPNVMVLLTKVDLLAAHERSEAVAFISAQLAKAFDQAPPVAPYSIRPGHEDLQTSLEHHVFQPAMASLAAQRAAVVSRKIGTLLRECSGYVSLSLKSAELLASERAALREQLIGQQQAIIDVKSQLRFIADRAASTTRSFVEARLRVHQPALEPRLLNDLAAEFPKWTKSLASLLDSFDSWFRAALSGHLAEISAAESSRLAEPLQGVSRQVVRILQDFRDRLAEGAMRAFGFPLRTTEMELAIRAPENPDIRIGSIFDRNWELLSPVMPLSWIRGLVRRHLNAQVVYVLSTNLSRLATQWVESLHAASMNMVREAERRLDKLVATVSRLIETEDSGQLPAIRRDKESIEALRAAIAGDSDGHVSG